MTAKEQKKAAAEFAAKWAGKGYEKGECQKFWRGLLHDVFEIVDPDDWVQYEVTVATGFVDAYISRTKVLIEQKGFEHGLADKVAMKQAMMYVGAMPDTMPVRYIVLSNFQEFWIYDKHAPEMKPVKVSLKDLPKKLGVLSFMTEVQQSVTIVRDVAAVDKRAGELVGKLYDALLKSYSGEIDEHTLESLNMLCVRLVFCAYAEDAGVFPKHDQFTDYMRRYDAESFRDRLAQLFRMLNTDYPDRDPDDIPALLEFPYVGSGLFDNEHIRIPRFTDETRTLLLDCMCSDLDWTEINPTIFGAVFESTLSTAMRRKNGMHYTTVKNIHRVADPLFLWSLEKELDDIAGTGNLKKRNESLVTFQKKLGSLRFLDPACGSGNFLTETYISLRRLENSAIDMRQQGQSEFDLGDTICVTIDQFYGIEIDDFAVSVAQTALWIAESQMMIETEKILHRHIDFLPLKRYAHIVKGNALRMDWNSILGEGEHFDYILGNPPFIGYSNQTPEQKADMLATFVDDRGKPLKTAGKIDYVAGWYWKAVQLPSRCAFVSTNSITQGEQVAAVWKPLKERFGVEIDFAWRTFVWDSEANEKAHVHVVIVGFHGDITKSSIIAPHMRLPAGTEPDPPAIVPQTAGKRENGAASGGARSVATASPTVSCPSPAGRAARPFAAERHAKVLFDVDGGKTEVSHINGYLMDGPNIFIESRTKPLCDVPEMTKGSSPVDGGNFFVEADDVERVQNSCFSVQHLLKRFYGAQEFLHNEKRWCFWLAKATPAEMRSSAEIVRRVEAVKEFRLASTKEATRKFADCPQRFMEIRQPDTEYIIIPRHTSENRKYIPFGFMSPDVICGDANNMIPDATLYHFGILTSSVHMAWMRAVAGRLEMRYRYSANIVYNNFPWPECGGFVETALPSDETRYANDERYGGEGSRRPTGEQFTPSDHVAKITETAQAILDARALYPDSSLADLYDDTFMPPELRKAHQANDAAVLAAYGFSPKSTEGEIVSKLFEMYAQLTAK